MKKKKLLSYILTTSLLISLTANPVLSMAEETNLSQEITVDQDNPDQDSKSQNISSEKNADSKDKNENDGSDRGDEIEPSEDGKTEDLQEDEDKANLSSGKDEKPDRNGSDGDQSEESKKDSINDSFEEDSDQADADYGRLDEDENIDPDFSQPEEDEKDSAFGRADETENIDPDFSQPAESENQNSVANKTGNAAGATTNSALLTEQLVSAKQMNYEDVEIEIDGITYTFDFDQDTQTAEITDIADPDQDTDLILPETVSYEEDGNDYTITSLSWGTVYPWSSKCDHITSVEIPDSVTVCDSSFLKFPNLTEIVIPGSITKFTGNFQAMDSLTKITFSEGVEEIASGTMVTNCSELKTIQLPESLKKISEYGTFASAKNLTDVVLPDGIDISDANELFENCTSLISMNLPESVNSIPREMFDGCTSLEKVTAEGTITKIGQQAFYEDKRLQQIPDLGQVSSMGTMAFYECYDLTADIDLSALSEVPYQAFSYSSIKSVILSDSLESIGDWAFLYTELSTITFPETLKSIGTYAFWHADSLTGTIVIPDSVTNIENNAFQHTTIETLVLGSGLSEIGSNAFEDIGTLKSVTVRMSSDDINLSNVGFSDDLAVTYTKSSIPDSIGSTISNEEGAPTLQDAINDSDATGGCIEIKKNIKLDHKVTIPSGSKVMITSEDAYTIAATKSGTVPDVLFEVESGAEVVFDGNLILSGRYNDGSIIKNHGILEIAGNTTVTDAQITNDRTGVIESSGEHAKLIISGGQIADNKIKNGAQNSATVLIEDGSSIEMTGGVIQNNNASDADFYHSTGGIFLCGKSDGLMTGGTIQKNTGHRGTAVAIYSDTFDQKASFVLSGDALLTHNNGISQDDTAYAAGGTVLVENNASFHMTGGKITDNKSRKGGGVCVIDDGVQNGTTEYGTKFLMDDGTISKNRASNGAGIYSFSNGTVLRGGKITDNKAGVSGGGIYSEGRLNNGYSSTHLYNAVVTNNTAQQGGGLWFCVTGTATLNIKDGIGIFENKADASIEKAAGDDLVFCVFGESDDNYTATLSSRMLGGGAVDWYQDGGIFNAVNASWPIVTEHDKRYDENDQQITPLDPENLVDIHTSQALKTIMSADAQDLAENEAKLFIEGNTAKYGGGIGANGGIIVGEDDTIDISVKKVWNNAPASGTPDSVTIRLINEGHVIDRAVLNAANNWEYQFEDLPKGYSYSVSEVVPADYTPTVSGNQTDGFQILNTYTPGTPAEPEKPDNGGTNPGNSNHGSGSSGSSGSGSSGESGSSTRTAQVVETTPVEPVKEDIQPIPEDIQHEDFTSEANSALPKTGQEANKSALVFFSSALLLFAMLIFKKKED